MQPLLLLQRLRHHFKDYVVSKYPWDASSPEYAQIEAICLRPGEVFQEPVLQFDLPRETRPLAESSEPEFFLAETRQLLRTPLPPKARTFTMPYAHQFSAWERIAAGKPTVVSTGTGSGKSEAFQIPVLDLVMRDKLKSPGKRVVRAIVIYPMNALVEDQHLRFCRFAKELGLKIGVYTGSFNEIRGAARQSKDHAEEWKKKIFGEELASSTSDDALYKVTQIVDPNDERTFPDILLTNYAMLEYMLLRNRDHAILKGASLQALVLDEAHLYSGTLALEMSSLIARLYVHLGTTAESVVPVATSATLVRAAEGATASVSELAAFFSALFGRQFSGDGKWLITDSFVRPKDPSQEFWKTLEFDHSKLRSLQALCAESPRFPVDELGKIVVASNHDKERLANEFPALLLKKDYANNEEPLASVVTWPDAVARYSTIRGYGEIEKTRYETEIELAFLLTEVSLPRGEKENPWLGLRVHAFTRSEPSLFRTFAAEKGALRLAEVISESDEEKRTTVLALPMALCRSCDHEGWIVIAEQQNPQEFILRPLLGPPLPDDVIWVLHDPVIVNGENFSDGWSLERILVSKNDDGEITAHKMASQSQRASNPLMHSAEEKELPGLLFVRVERIGKDEGDSGKGVKPDNTHCPCCLKTHFEQMVRRRGSASSDLGVHTRNILGGIESEQEKSLLVFCDNRQDTSFMAGFLTDRHKRFRLRRAIVQTVQELKTAQTTFLDLENNRLPFAEGVLRSLKRLVGDTSGDNQVEARTFQKCLPAELFDFSKDFSSGYAESIRLFIDKIHPSELVSEEAKELQKMAIDLGDPRAKAAVKLLNEAILRDLALGAYREGALPTLGLAALWHQAFYDAELPYRNLALLLFWECLENMSWSDKPPALRNPQYRFESLDVQRLADALASNRTTIGRALRANEPNLATAWGLIDRKGSAAKGNSGFVREELNKILAEYDKRHLFVLGPASGTKKEVSIKLCTAGFVVSGKNTIYESSIRKYRTTVPAGVSLDGLETGLRKQDRYAVSSRRTQVPLAWQQLYLRGFDSDDNFVRAHEHNAMLKGTLAAQVIEEFKTRNLNTLVATPTLEVGIDLPDLPVVIHRSVPPDPSNYAQRSGRAGRDSRRALLLAHCGRGSHDSSYYIEPEAMVAGEIMPPGVPRENTWILRRHVRALVLTVIAGNPEFSLSTWNSLLDRASFIAEIRKKYDDKFAPQASLGRPGLFDWRGEFTKRRTEIGEHVELLIIALRNGIWSEAERMSRPWEDLAREVNQAVADFPQHFADAIESYRQLIEVKLNCLRMLEGKHRDDDNRERRRVFAGVAPLLDDQFSRGGDFRPIPYLAAIGFLPNFDFPSEMVRFSGLGYNHTDISKPNMLVSFQRPVMVAQTEFAPEQRVYSSGMIFEVERYSAKQAQQQADSLKYGVCSAGCTELTLMEAGAKSCRICSQPLVGGTNAAFSTPMVEIAAVEGWKQELIGDTKADREYHRLTRKSLIVKHDRGAFETYQHGRIPACSVEFFRNEGLTGENLTFVSVMGLREPGLAGGLAPILRDSDTAESFRVRLRASEKEPEICKPFLVGYRFEAEAVRIQVPIESLALVSPGVSQASTVYRTLKAVLLKAARRELFLSARSAHLDAILEEVSGRDASGKTFKSVIALYLFDGVKGGSGVIPLVHHYWDAIMERAHRMILSTERPFDCCESSCSRCLRSFDNQGDHSSLNKAALKVLDDDSVTTVPTLLKGIGGRKTDAHSHWKFAPRAAPHVPADEEEYEPFESERCFETFMQERFGSIAYSKQFEIKNLGSGGLVTVADYSFEDAGLRYLVFVDGAKDHSRREIFKADLAKRNFCNLIARWSVITVPAAYVLGGKRFDRLSEVFASILNGRNTALDAFRERSRAKFDDVLYELSDRLEESERIRDGAWRTPSSVLLEAVGGLSFSTLVGIDAKEPLVLIEVDLLGIYRGPDPRKPWHEFWEGIWKLQICGLTPVFIWKT